MCCEDPPVIEDEEGEIDDIIREVAAALQTKLATVASSAIKAVSDAIRSHHTKWLDVQRQIRTIEEKIDKQELPRGWKLQQVELGPTNASFSEKIKKVQIEATVDAMREMLEAKEANADQHRNDRCTALSQAVERHRAMVERMVSANPDRYVHDVDVGQAVDEATEALAHAVIEAEYRADLESRASVMTCWYCSMQ